jgi:hypothetical protein
MTMMSEGFADQLRRQVEAGEAARLLLEALGLDEPAEQDRSAEIREWARSQGLQVSARGRIPAAVQAAFAAWERQGRPEPQVTQLAPDLADVEQDSPRPARRRRTPAAA